MSPRTKKNASATNSSKTSSKPLKTKAVKAEEKTPIAERVVNQTEMAAILGVSTRFLRELTSDGTIAKSGSGYQVGRTVRTYADFLKVGSEKKSGSASLDTLREEKALEIRLNRERKDRLLISMDEALSAVEEVTGMYVSSLTGLPAQITGVPRERQRLNDIFDAERLRLTDRFTKRIATLRTGEEDTDTEAED